MASWGAFFRVMATTRARRIGRREAEELLSGARTAADRDALIRLLDLAAAPPQPAELASREATVRALVQTYREAFQAAQTRRRSGLSLLSKAIGVKVFAGLIVLALGGVAVAATTGSLPPPVQHGAHNLLSPLGVVVPDGKAPRPDKDSGDTPRQSNSPSPTHTPSTSADPSGPAIHRLCQAWQAQQKGPASKSMDPAAFQKLAAAAGGADKVPTFCATVLDQQQPRPGGPPSSKAKPVKPSITPRKVYAPSTTDRRGLAPGLPVSTGTR